MDAGVWHPTVFTHNRDRLTTAEVAREFLGALMGLAQVKRLLSSDHFSVDGTLIDAWASMKSFRASATLRRRSARTRRMPRRPTRTLGFAARPRWTLAPSLTSAM